ncbi:unnamed protein product [Closterium sp. NIES-64]|nr:unnamed protein product [Closterium sp. NIES-64]
MASARRCTHGANDVARCSSLLRASPATRLGKRGITPLPAAIACLCTKPHLAHSSTLLSLPPPPSSLPSSLLPFLLLSRSLHPPLPLFPSSFPPPVPLLSPSYPPPSRLSLLPLLPSPFPFFCPHFDRPFLTPSFFLLSHPITLLSSPLPPFSPSVPPSFPLPSVPPPSSSISSISPPFPFLSPSYPPPVPLFSSHVPLHAPCFPSPVPLLSPSVQPPSPLFPIFLQTPSYSPACPLLSLLTTSFPPFPLPSPSHSPDHSLLLPPSVSSFPLPRFPPPSALFSPAVPRLSPSSTPAAPCLPHAFSRVRAWGRQRGLQVPGSRRAMQGRPWAAMHAQRGSPLALPPHALLIRPSSPPAALSPPPLCSSPHPSLRCAIHSPTSPSTSTPCLTHLGLGVAAVAGGTAAARALHPLSPCAASPTMPPPSTPHGKHQLSTCLSRIDAGT